jgi:hypothetical protein
MLPNTRKQIADKLDELYKSTIDSVLIPVVTNTGIIVGDYMIRISKDYFLVTRRGKTLYKTFSKSAALVIAGLLNKSIKHKEINSILEIDKNIDKLKNDLIIFKHHRDVAIRKRDHIKKGIIEARFEVANDQYENAKSVLKKSYSKLF